MFSLSFIFLDWICPFCRPDNPRGESDPMIECDSCDTWYHYSCVNLLQEPSKDESWFCPKCQPSKTKKQSKHSKLSKGSKAEKKESKNSSDWSCLVCGKSNNSKPTICCDSCDKWYHWPCVGITKPPKEQDSWFCKTCLKSQSKHH